MSRRTVAGLLAIVLIGALVVIAAGKPVPWATFRPGPTLNVLGDYDGKQIIKVTGRKTYPDQGALRMVTVYPSGPEDKLDLFTVLWSWASPADAVLPRDVVYKDAETNDSVRQESALQMSTSQDSATAAALDALGVKYRTDLVVAQVAKDGAAAKILRKGDVIRAIDGRTDADPNVMVDRIRKGTPGTTINLTIVRNGKQSDVRITTRPAEDDPRSARIGIAPGTDYAFPFDVDVQLPETIGGPSAGMIFALSIYDLLTPGSLTGGKAVAGTGEIAGDGVVGPIGGIGQKLAGAQRDGAELFLAPEENCAEAARAHYDRDKLRVVKIHTLEEAIKAVDTWRKNPDADLPRCTR